MTHPEIERAALAGSPISNATALDKQNNLATPTETIQRRRLCRIYHISAAAAITVAELAFAGCPR
jgi:hypothetical protein